MVLNGKTSFFYKKKEQKKVIITTEDKNGIDLIRGVSKSSRKSAFQNSV